MAAISATWPRDMGSSSSKPPPPPTAPPSASSKAASARQTDELLRLQREVREVTARLQVQREVVSEELLIARTRAEYAEADTEAPST